MILVTGGTGFIGSHLLLYLTRKGHQVRALYRNKASIDKTKQLFELYTPEPEKLLQKIEWFEADITDITELSAAFSQITQVYHTAALVSFDKKDKALMHLTNVEGTANMVNLSNDYQVEKFVHLSSIAALGSYDNPITEKTHWNWKEKHSEYAITKYLSEMEVWRAGQEGLNTVILNPSVVLGAGFWDEGTGKIFQKVQQGIQFYTTGINGFVDVWDVVKAMYLTMNDDKISIDSFIVSAGNISYKTLLEQIAMALNKPKPTYKLPKSLLKLSLPFNPIRSLVTQKPALVTSEVINSLYSQNYYSSEKIKKRLNFQFIPIEAGIQNIANQFKKVIK